MASTSSAGPALAPAQDKADSVSLIASSSAGPALAPAQGKADSEADSEAAAPASARGEGPASCRARHTELTHALLSIALPPPEEPDRLFTFDLVWPSGDVIKQYTEEPDLNVELFRLDMIEGRIPGVPRIAANYWLEFYDIAWGTQVLQDGWLSEYSIPDGATLTVIRCSRRCNGVSSRVALTPA